MHIGIVGGNGQVGIELSFLLRAAGHEVRPIVRNRFGGAFLSSHGFDCAVEDVTDAGEAAEAVGDLDAVLVAAYAPPFSGSGDNPRHARTTNEDILTNVIERTPTGAPVVYFSSISAFGDDLYTNGARWRFYAREKRHLEEVVLEAGGAATGYALRLGHVVGPNQLRSAQLRSALDSDAVRLGVPPDTPSNTLHTVTLAEAVAACCRGDPDEGRYTVVNEPQWSWRRVLERHAASGTRLVFDPPSSSDDSTFGPLVNRAMSLVQSYKHYLIPYQVYLPGWLNRRVIHRFRKKNLGADLDAYRDRTTVTFSEFTHQPVPGPYFPDLTETAERLDAVETFAEVYCPE